MSRVKYDEIGYWSEIKLDILRKYASAYTTIMSKQSFIKHYLYIDAFAGAGVHISKLTGEFIKGSPLNALLVKPPFTELHFIDMDKSKVGELRKLAEDRTNVFIYAEDCNKIIGEQIFPRCLYEEFSRGLCLLDPYGLHLDWSVIHTAGQMKSIEIFLNFPVMDMNMNVLWNDPDKVQSEQAERMDKFWGDNSWRNAAYQTTQNLFGYPEKSDNRTIAEAFRKRLTTVAGFQYVPEPLPMKNTKGAIVYYLFFASPNGTGGKIVNQIFEKYKNHGYN